MEVNCFTFVGYVLILLVLVKYVYEAKFLCDCSLRFFGFFIRACDFVDISQIVWFWNFFISLTTFTNLLNDVNGAARGMFVICYFQYTADTLLYMSTDSSTATIRTTPRPIPDSKGSQMRLEPLIFFLGRFQYTLLFILLDLSMATITTTPRPNRLVSFFWLFWTYWCFYNIRFFLSTPSITTTPRPNPTAGARALSYHPTANADQRYVFIVSYFSNVYLP